LSSAGRPADYENIETTGSAAVVTTGSEAPRAEAREGKPLGGWPVHWRVQSQNASIGNAATAAHESAGPFERGNGVNKVKTRAAGNPANMPASFWLYCSMFSAFVTSLVPHTGILADGKGLGRDKEQGEVKGDN